VAVRFHGAQHSVLENLEFRLADAFAAVEDAGNLIEGCRFFGGNRALDTRQTSASWQTLLVDCTFEGQTSAAIVTEKAGLTLERCDFRNSPCGVQVRPGTIEQLWARNCRFHDVEVAVATSYRQRAENQVNLRDCSLTATPTLVSFSDGSAAILGTGTGPGINVCADRLTVGLRVVTGPAGSVRQTFEPLVHLRPLAEPAAHEAPDAPPLPPPETWVSALDCGVVGDGITDDTLALQAALHQHRVLYLPNAHYRVTDTLTLQPDAFLFGLQPNGALLELAASTPGFQNRAQLKPVLQTTVGGEAHVSGLGLRVDRDNPGAVALRWRSGPRSSLRDVCIGTWPALLERAKTTGDWTKGTGIAHNLEVCQGGGGVFRNLWSENWLGLTGLYVHDTDTPSTVSLVSVEHHSQREVVLQNVRHWEFVALQTEEHYWSEHEESTSVNAMALEVTNCQELTFANLFAYRTISQPRSFPFMLGAAGGSSLTMEGLLIFSWGQHPFDNAVLIAETGEMLPYRALAQLTLQGEI